MARYGEAADVRRDPDPGAQLQPLLPRSVPAGVLRSPARQERRSAGIDHPGARRRSHEQHDPPDHGVVRRVPVQGERQAHPAGHEGERPAGFLERRTATDRLPYVAGEQRGHRIKKTLEIDPFQAETVRLIFRLALEGDGTSGPMGVKSMTNHLNATGIRTRDGGRWGIDAVHKVLTRTTYIGRHRVNTKFWKTRERKPETEVVEMMVPTIMDKAEFEAVQAHLRSRSPAWTAPRIVSGPTLLTGICFCAACGMAMTLRTGKSGRYRYYTCLTKARQGETGCRGHTVPMEKLDTLVADHIEHRLLLSSRLEKILSSVLDRREERTERQATHIAELRKRATEVDAKLKRLYDAIENGVTDMSDLMLKDRITELNAIRDQTRADAERAEGAIERQGPTITTQSIKTLPGRPASGCAQRAAAIAAITCARWPSASKSTRKNFASWARKASCCARSSPLQAQKRRVLACPVLYRSGAPGAIRTPTPDFPQKY